MDISLYVLGLIFPLVLTLLAIVVNARKVKGILLAGMSAVGGLVGVYFFLGLGTDGSITQYSSAGLLETLSSATLNQFTWTFVTYLPLVFGFLGFMGALYRIVNS